MKKYARILLSIFLGAFAILTFYLSTSVILDLFHVRESEGQYVLFVVWANWVCSVIYFIAIYGLIKKKRWVVKWLLIAVGLLLLTEVGLQFHISAGGAYEQKTVFALLFRAAVTSLFAWAANALRKKQIGGEFEKSE